MHLNDEDALHLLDERGIGLTKWEIDFVDSCMIQLANQAGHAPDSPFGLTPKQRVKLWQIIVDRVPEDLQP